MNAVIESIEKIEQGAESNVQEIRVVKEWPVDAVVRQGDIYVLRMPEDYEHGKKLKERQLVDGQTQGSRHVVEEGPTIHAAGKAPSWLFAETAKSLGVSRQRLLKALLGPSIKANKAFKITHPEHAHVEAPCGSYITWSQMDARMLERVRD